MWIFWHKFFTIFIDIAKYLWTNPIGPIVVPAGDPIGSDSLLGGLSKTVEQQQEKNHNKGRLQLKAFQENEEIKERHSLLVAESVKLYLCL